MTGNRGSRGASQPRVSSTDALTRDEPQNSWPTFCIDVLDTSVEPPHVRFETQTKTKLLGSAEALARALYERRYGDGYPKDIVRVRYENKTVFIYSYLDHAEQKGGRHAEQASRPAAWLERTR